ncbi:MAG: serine/threonine-protein kinase [Phycisphaerales bacterium]
MNPDRFERIRELFLQARAVPQAERSKWITEHCGGDEGLADEVRSLLDAESTNGGSSVIDNDRIGSQLASAIAADEGPLPEQIGQYRIVRLIGEGGMGRVFEAEQARPARRVALKVLRSGFPTRQALQRFEREAELLARLQHPGIAQVYESGVFSSIAPSGAKSSHPFFAMELVRGVPLSEFARSKNPARAERLELLATVCDAVHHAHLRGIVHRDLKPGNILVESDAHGGQPRPKVLDFGVGRVLEEQAGGNVTLQTEAGQIIGTLSYMSPEQIAGTPADPRSDVYSLGVVLYELLTGRLPHDLATRSIVEAARTIQHDSPARPSAVVRDLRGDLETVVLKAIERDPARRYASAADLADDLRRFMTNRPINARPPTRWYLFSTFARRNKGLVAGSAATLVALIAGLAVSITLYIQAKAAREAADISNAAASSARDRAEGINSFLVDDLLRIGAEDDDARAMKLYDAVKKAADNIDKRFDKHPETGSSVRSLVGSMLNRFGDYDAAIALHLKASEEMAARLGPDAKETLEARYSLALAYMGAAKHAEAEAVLRDLVDRRKRLLGEKDPRTQDAAAMLADALQSQGRSEDAERVFKEAIPVLRDAGPAWASSLCNALGNYGSLLRNKGRLDEAEKTLEESIAVAKSLNRPLSPAVLMNSYGLAAIYFLSNRYDKCEQMLAEVIPSFRRAFGDQSYEVAMVLSMRGKNASRAGDLKHAEEYLVAAFEMGDRVLGRKRYETEQFNQSLVAFYRRSGDTVKLESALIRAVELRESIQGEPRHGSVLGVKEEYSSFLLSQGRSAEAKIVMEPVLQLAINYLSETDPVRERVFETAARCGLSLPPKEGKPSKAEAPPEEK